MTALSKLIVRIEQFEKREHCTKLSEYGLTGRNNPENSDFEEIVGKCSARRLKREKSGVSEMYLLFHYL